MMFQPFLASLFLLAPVVGAKNLGLTVKTSSGTFTGFVNSSAPDVYQWLGVPYAQPPVGSLRFMPPVAAPYSGDVDTQAYKPVCLQANIRTGLYWDLLPQFENRDAQSEDCLYLNIWAPRKPVEKKLPVIIWVCGGGFKEGGGHADYQVPDQWIQRTQTHIVVAMNYRVNIFGFPGSPIANKNAGLLDIKLVVEWLQDNIQGFGGDPKRMVLYGQSAGAVEVLMYAYANPKKPIVTGLIASSSGTSATYATSSPLFHNLAQTVGCANLTSTDELACMQNLDALALQAAVIAANPDPNRGLFRPLADNITLFANMTDRLEKGLVAKLPLITGFNYNEPAALLPFNLSMTAPPNVTVPGASGLACGVKREANIRLNYGLTTYRYLYAGNFSNITPRWWVGGMHSSEIPLVFGTHFEYRGNSTELEWQTSYAMESFWVSFASNPSADPKDNLGQTWPKYTSTSGDIMVFGNASMPGVATVAPVSLANFYSDPC